MRRLAPVLSVLVVAVFGAGCTERAPTSADEKPDLGQGQPAFTIIENLGPAVGEAHPEGPPGFLDGLSLSHTSSPNLLVNGGFEAGDFTGWTRAATGFGISGNTAIAWQVGAFETTQGAHGSQPHTEPLNNSGQFGATAVENGGTNFLLFQDITLPSASALTLSYFNRIKNFHREVFGFDWIPNAQDYKVQIRNTSNTVLATLFQASASGAPPFSGGGDRNQAFFVQETFDISAFAGQTIRLAFEINVCCWFFFVDLDDIEIFVPFIEVDIDIKPGSDPNSINLGNQGVIPVAILTTATFNAADIDPTTVTLGNDDGNDTPVAARKNGSLMASLEDVDGDGDLDLILHFRTQALVANRDLDANTTELLLNGETAGGQLIQGKDAVRVVPES